LYRRNSSTISETSPSSNLITIKQKGQEFKTPIQSRETEEEGKILLSFQSFEQLQIFPSGPNTKREHILFLN
jgi:hypothetical protein